MLTLIAKTREPLLYLRTIVGILFTGVAITWAALEMGSDREVLKLSCLGVLFIYILVLVVLHQSKVFNVTGDVVKRIAPLLLIANLAEWSDKGFNYWVQSSSILAGVYILLFAYEKFHIVNKLSHHLVIDPDKEFIYEGEEDDSEEEVSKNIIRSYVNTFKDIYKEKVIAYNLTRTRDSDGIAVRHIDFALQTEKKSYHLFEVELKEEK